MPNWIDKLIKATEEAETPVSYIYWSGVATISAVIGPNVWINRRGVYKLSPNLFIMLIGESGLGKGLPINISKQLVTKVGSTRVISGRNTIQAIVQELGRTETNEKTGIPAFKDARGYIVSGELSTLLQEDKAALPILTELYDTHFNEDWKNTTKNSGKDKLDKVNVTLFAGSTPEHFQNVVPETDVKGGFVGRLLTVYAEKRSKINALEDTENEYQFPYEELLEHLRVISLVRGPFQYSPEGKVEWKRWYHEIRGREIHDPTGAVNRLPDNVLKVAMCLSMGDDIDKVIHKKHLEESIEKCMELTIDSRKLTEGKGKSPLGEQTKLVLEVLFRAENHMLTKSHILRRYYGQFDVHDLDKIISTLESADFIECSMVGGQVILQLKAEVVEGVNKLMER